MGVELGFQPEHPGSESMVIIQPCNEMGFPFSHTGQPFWGNISVSSYLVPIGERFHSNKLGLESTFCLAGPTFFQRPHGSTWILATGPTFQFTASLLLFFLFTKMPKIDNTRSHREALVML